MLDLNIQQFGWSLAMSMFCAGWALAQDLAPGAARVTAQSLSAYSSGNPIVVEAEADSELNARLTDVIRRDLKSRNAGTRDGTSVLTLRFSTSASDYDAQSRHPTMELEGRGGSRGRSSVTGVLTLPLGKKHQQQQAAVTEHRLHLRFNLFSPDGKIIWEGEIVAPREQADRYVVFARLVPVLLERMGKTIPAEIVPF